MKKSKKVTYIAKTVVYSLQHNAYFQPGEVIEWDYDGENVPNFQALIDLDVIAPPGEPKEINIEEVAHGADGFNSTDSVK